MNGQLIFKENIRKEKNLQDMLLEMESTIFHNSKAYHLIKCQLGGRVCSLVNVLSIGKTRK